MDEQAVELLDSGVGGDELIDLGRPGVERAVALERDPRGQARAAEDVLALARADRVVHESLVDGALQLAGLPLLDALVQHDGTPLFFLVCLGHLMFFLLSAHLLVEQRLTLCVRVFHLGQVGGGWVLVGVELVNVVVVDVAVCCVWVVGW